MIPDRLISSTTQVSVEGVCIVITIRQLAEVSHLTVLEVVQKDVKSLALDTILFHDDTAASHNLSWVTLTIDLAETRPSSKDFRITDFDEVNLVLSTERLNELDVFRFCARLDQHAQMCLALVEGFGALTKTASETVMNESIFQNLL
jgi:hypothetical protein